MKENSVEHKFIMEWAHELVNNYKGGGPHNHEMLKHVYIYLFPENKMIENCGTCYKTYIEEINIKINEQQ